MTLKRGRKTVLVKARAAVVFVVEVVVVVVTIIQTVRDTDIVLPNITLFF